MNQLCDRVGVIDRGRLVAQGALADLCGPTGRALVRVSDPAAAVAALDGRVEGRDGDRLTIAEMPVADVTRLLVERGVGVLEAAPERRTLEDVVLSITGHGSDRFGVQR